MRPRFGHLVLVVVCFQLAASHLLLASDWPGFRGPNSDGTIAGEGMFTTSTTGLAVGWEREIGAGYSAVAVAGNRVVTMFAGDEFDYVGAFDETSGEELWRYALGETYKGHDGSHDGPISTPLIADGRVYGLGPRGHLVALEADSGGVVWKTHLVDDLEAKKPHYGFSSSPIMAGRLLIVEIGGEGGRAIAGFDSTTGALEWAVGDDEIHYHSPILSEIGGRSQVIAAGSANLLGLDPASGEVLWTFAHEGEPRAMAGATIVPLPSGEGRFFVMNKMDSSAMVEVTVGEDGSYTATELWSSNSIRSSYVTPVYHRGLIYGMSGRILSCVDAETGELKWRSRKPGDGFLSIVDDHLVIMTKPGSLHVAEASADGYREIASLDLFDDHSWSEVAIANGHVFARSMKKLARIDVVATAEAQNMNAWMSNTDFGDFLAKVEAESDQASRQSLVDDYLSAHSRFPIIEGSDVVHFVYRGDANDVGIVGDVVGFRREDPMARLAGTDLFYYSTRLEPEAAVTYGFIVDYGDVSADPLNQERADGLFGEVSWLAMPAWTGPDFLTTAPAEKRGKLETVEWQRDVIKEVDGEEQSSTETRTARVYLPAGFDPAADTRYPSVYFVSGRGALEDGSTKNALDNLIGESIADVIGVFLMPLDGGENDRVGPMDEFLAMVTTELVPLIDERFPTVQDPRSRAIVGSADPGVAALTAAIQHPDVFGRVGAQSAVLFEVYVGEMLDEADQPELTVYLDWGTYDLRSPHEAWDMVANNRDAWNSLRERGYRPAGGELPEGHSWRNWSNQTDEMLRALFPAVGD